MATSFQGNLLRPLGPTEHYFWLSNINSAKHFVLAAEIVGNASVDAWVSAIAAAQRRHPLLRVSVEYGTDGPSFVEHANIPIPVRILAEEEPASWHGEMAKELATPIPLSGAPLARITVLQKSAGSTLLLSMHHSIADGLSAAFVIRDILEALSGKPLRPLALTEPQDDLCSAAASTLPPSSLTGRPPSTLLRRDTEGPTVQALKLSEELTTNLRRRARDVGTTVHGALVSAVTFAGRQRSPDWLAHPVRVLSPVNNRKLLGLEDECALAIIFPSGAYAPESAERLWDVARAVKDELTPMRTAQGLSAVFSDFRQLMSTSPDVAQIAAFELQVAACEAMVSNLGVLPFQTSFGGFKLGSLWGPSVFVGIEGEQMIGVTTLNGAIHLLHTSYTPIPKLLETMEATLKSMVQ
jgi:hypothetical protein